MVIAVRQKVEVRTKKGHSETPLPPITLLEILVLTYHVIGQNSRYLRNRVLTFTKRQT